MRFDFALASAYPKPFCTSVKISPIKLSTIIIASFVALQGADSLGTSAALAEKELNCEALDKLIRERIPSGFDVRSEPHRNAKRIYLRDRLKHESPNSAHTEATCAGALGVQLAGPAVYEGKIERKDFLGDPDRKIEFEDIKKANRLSYATAFTCVIFCSTIILAILFLLYNYKGGN